MAFRIYVYWGKDEKCKGDDLFYELGYLWSVLIPHTHYVAKKRNGYAVIVIDNDYASEAVAKEWCAEFKETFKCVEVSCSESSW